MGPRLLLAVAIGAAAGLSHCHPHRGTLPDRALASEQTLAAPRVSSANFGEILRSLDEVAPSRRNRPVRDAVASYLAQRGMERVDAGDYEGAVNALRRALVNYSADELSQGHVPDTVTPLAQAILAISEPRGDEARSLAATRVLTLVQTTVPGAMDHFDAVRTWGEQNRREFRPTWIFHAEMADLYREVSHILPERSLVDQAREQSTRRREAAMRALAAVGAEPRSREEVMRLQRAIERPVFDIALIYLRLGELEAAADRVEAITGPNTRGLAALLRSLAEQPSPDGLLALAQQLEQLDASAMAGVCRVGRRRFTNEPRFATCLASASVRDGQPALLAAHLEAASQMQPEDPEGLGRAIAGSTRWLQDELSREEPDGGRAAVRRLREQLQRWGARFESRPPPISLADVDFLAARLEISHGDVAATQALLAQAIARPAPPRAAMHLVAEIAWRQGNTQVALSTLDRARTLPLDANESGSEVAPIMLLLRGEAMVSSADRQSALPVLTQAEADLAAVARSLEGERKSVALLNLARAQSALGHTEQATRSVEAAVAASPENREYASAAVVFFMGRSQWADAARVARAARARLSLDRHWETYFTLWSWAASKIEGNEDEHDRHQLRQLATTTGAHASWTSRIAQRFVGTLTAEELSGHANSPGRRCEAAFYEGLLALTRNESPAAQQLFRAAVDTHVMTYLEYAASWQLVARASPSTTPTVTQPASP